MKLLILFLLVYCFSTYSQPIEQNIYLIKNVCGNHCQQTLQTGFRLKNHKGIYTTLHGLSGATKISAKNNKNQFENLNIVMVDFGRDIAILSNSELDKAPLSEGLTEATDLNFPVNTSFFFYGHPFGVAMVPRNDIKLANPALITLIDRIPKAEQKLYKDRKSPRLDIEVIEMRYNFGNGESGSPILNPQNQVIGINDGGYASINISWAIPITKIKLTNKINFDSINNLKSIPVKLHSYQIDVEEISGLDVTELSEKFQNWYFSLMKINPTNDTVDRIKFFDKNALSNSFINIMGYDNGDKYLWVPSTFYVPYQGFYLPGHHPMDFIVVNVDKSIPNRNIFTVYFRYSVPLYAIKYKKNDDSLNYPYESYLYTFIDLDYIKQQKNIAEYKLANIQATFILDDENKLVDITEIKSALPGDSYFQKR
jgi:hypothetical protein